ncbi:hypothetical protein R6Q57_007266, partial [Mikania cordata]
LGTVHLCRSVIRSIETARIFDFEEFPVRDKVTYMYYTGRLEVLNENFPAADHKLSYALKHCDPQSEGNIRMILKYLIPVKLSIGILPKESLLEKYNLVEYSDIVLAMKRGDLRLLRHALEEHEDRHSLIGKLINANRALNLHCLSQSFDLEDGVDPCCDRIDQVGFNPNSLVEPAVGVVGYSGIDVI